jgi:glycosyltransferase involved in cell wall biosynthesis
MNVKKVSVIVPVYNVSKYLERCLNSLVNQTLTDIEIIIINDVSPDPLDDKICLKYAKKDSRIKYIKHKKNKNLGGARNTGINAAEGEYIAFVDSDDWVDLDMYEILYSKAKETGFDIISSGSIREFENGRSSAILNANETDDEWIWDDLLTTFLKARAGEIDKRFPSSVWNKLYKRSFLNKHNIRFEEGYYFEELMFSINSFYYCKKMMLLPQNFYHWYIREGSISNTVTDLHMNSIFYGYQYIKDFFKKKKIYTEENKRLIDKLFYRQLFDIYICNNGDKIKPYINKIIQKMNKDFDNYNFIEFCILDKIELKKEKEEINKLQKSYRILENKIKVLDQNNKKLNKKIIKTIESNKNLKKEKISLSEINKKIIRENNILKSSTWYKISKKLSKNLFYKKFRQIFKKFF